MIKEKIFDYITKHGKTTTRDLAYYTKKSRTYIHRNLKKLVEEGKIKRVGSTNRSYYILSGLAQKNTRNTWHKTFLNKKDLAEDIVFNQSRDETTIFANIKPNVIDIFFYAFTEIFNNAIEHSQSVKLDVRIERDDAVKNSIFFWIRDNGIGIFEHIKKRKKISTVQEAIEDLLKGKLTTYPSGHSGEGIFFTSKIADYFRIRSHNIVLIFDNKINDLFVGEDKIIKGTEVFFEIGLNNKKDLVKLFDEYCSNDEKYAFDKTFIYVKVYQIGVSCVSRSQAKRLLTRLENFERIHLDFKDVRIIGQGFADEIFRVWHNKNKKKTITYDNTNNNVKFMIERAKNS